MCTRAAIVCFQEHGLLQEQIPEASSWLRQRGWKSLWEPALKTGGGTSGGTGIAAWEVFGMTEPNKAKGSPWPSRMRLAVMEVPTWGRVLVASGYFEVKSGLGKVNLEGLQRLGQALSEEELPFVVAADWNLKPEVLTGSEFPKRAAAVVIAKDGVPTCISKKKS